MRRFDKKAFGLVVVLVASCAVAAAQEPQQAQLLRYKWTQGSTYVWTITSQQQGTVTQGGTPMQPVIDTVSQVFGQVSSVTPEGYGQVALRFGKVRATMSMGGMQGMETVFDPDAGTMSQSMAGQAPQQQQLPQQSLGALRAGFTVTMNERGVTMGITGIEEYMMALNQTGAAAVANIALLDALFIPFPENPVNPGDTWDPPAPVAQPAPAPTPAPAGPFGAAPAPAGNAFGAPAPATPFGAPAPAPAAGPFGAPAAAPAAPFGAPAAAPAAPAAPMVLPVKFRYDGVETVGGLPYHKMSIAMETAVPDGVVPMGPGAQVENKGVKLTTSAYQYRSMDSGIIAYGQATNKQLGTMRNTSTMQGPDGQQMQMDMSMTDMTTQVETRRES